ncbi:hypothetical protein ACEQ8H_000424 [Pleosporales sp. CAS-2024a]
MTDPYLDPTTYKSTRRNHKKLKHARPPHFTPETSEAGSETDMDMDPNAHLYPYPPTHTTSFADFSPFPRTCLRLPQQTTSALRTDQILILPSHLTPLKISLHTHAPPRAIRAAVAGDMRLRDVVKQVLPHDLLGDARVHVKSRGEWVEPGNPIMVSHVVDLGRFATNERGEVEVRIMLARRERQGERDRQGYKWERRREGARGWEKEVGIGRVERMRML